MDRAQLLELWNDMWKEGNWVPSLPDSLAELSAEAAAWSPDPNCHSVWQEVVHIVYWRSVTLKRMAGEPPPSDEEILRLEFALPEPASEANWATTLAALKQTQDDLAAAIRRAQPGRERVERRAPIPHGLRVEGLIGQAVAAARAGRERRGRADPLDLPARLEPPLFAGAAVEDTELQAR